jgi:hypothetical protein
MRAIDAFLNCILDYAGVFPPASLNLDQALENYREYQSSPQAQMLARFVLPLDALAKVNEATLPLRITLVVRGQNIALPELPDQVESIELAGTIAGDGQDRFVFHEIDWRGDFATALDSLAGRRRTGVKLRTGGVTPESVPSAETVARFLIESALRSLPVKFTAGLHAPFPHDDPSVGSRMHGFVNVFGAAFGAYSGERDASLLATLLCEADARDFRFTETHIAIADVSFSSEEIVRLREEAVISFGSCSFLEPVGHLQGLGWIG